MTLAQMQARFFELKGKLAVGQITEQDFKHELEKLRFQDPHGRWWMIGAQSGRWYYYDGARWLLGDPPDLGAPGLDAGIATPVTPPIAPRPLTQSVNQSNSTTDYGATSAQTISAPYSYAPAPPATPAAAPAPTNGGSSLYGPSAYVAQPTRPPNPAPAPPYTAKALNAAPAFAAAQAQSQAQSAAQPKHALGNTLRDDLNKVHLPRVQMPQIQRPHIPPQFLPHAPTPVRKYQPPFILIGAVVVGLVLVALLWLFVDNLVPNRPISTFFARTFVGQSPARPTTTRQTAAVAPNQNVENLLSKGDEYTSQSKFETAMEQYQAAAKQSPNKADVYWHWARALALTGRIGEAVAQAEKATRLDPSSANAFAELTRAYAWAGQNQDAITAGEKAIELDSENATAQAFLAEAYLRAGRNEDAQRTIDTALELDDLNPETHRVAGWIAILSGRKDEGVGEWNRTIELAPDVFLYHYEFGLVFANHLNDAEMAVQSFQKAIDLYPSYIPSYVALGRAYLATKQPGPAILQFQKALTLDAKSTDAFVGLGQAFQMQQKCPQAIPYFQKAKELNADLPPASKGLEDCGALAKGTAPQVGPTTVAIVPLATAIPQATVAPAAGSNSTQARATPVAGPASANPGKGRIYFPVYDGQYHLYSANPDGSDRQLLRDLASNPSVSTDGSRMLYYSWESDQRGIHRINTDGTIDVHLSLRAEDTLPSWSPDGTKYVYATRAGQGGDITKRAYTIRAANTASKPRQDPNPIVEQAQYPSWSPNGQIVFRDCGFPDDNCGLALSNEDGSNKTTITNINSTAPAWSPDGSRIVFMSNVSGNWDVWTVSPNGGSPERLTDDPADDGLPVYSPDGSKIAFVSQRGGQWGIWEMDANGENETKLFDLGGEIAGTIAGNNPAQPGQTWLGQRISWR